MRLTVMALPCPALAAPRYAFVFDRLDDGEQATVADGDMLAAFAHDAGAVASLVLAEGGEIDIQRRDRS